MPLHMHTVSTCQIRREECCVDRLNPTKATSRDAFFARDFVPRFFNSVNTRPARRPSLVAVESELLGVVGAARLECGEPATEAGELIRR